MRRKPNIWTWCLLLALSLTAAAPGRAADNFDPDQFLRNASVKAELAKIASDDQAQALVRTHIVTAAGHTNTLYSFAQALAGGDYTEQIATIMEVPTQQWNFSRGMQGSYDIVNVKQMVQQNKTASLFGSVKENMSYLATALSVYSICNDAIAGFNGDSASQLKAVKGTYDLVSGYWAQRIGWDSLGTAMLGVGVISYALDSFIAQTMGTYTDFWWQAYTAYLDKKYPNQVTGANSWAAVYKNGGEAALDHRLMEFWDDALLNAADYYKNPPPNSNSLYAYNQFSKKFAAQYYHERLHPTMKTYFQNQAEIAAARAEIAASNAHALMLANLKDLAALQAAIQDAANNKGEMDRILAIRPPARTIKVGESVTFTTLFLYEDASTTPATNNTAFSGAASGPTFNATEVGTFVVTATCEGLSCEATVTVEEKIGDDDEEDEIEEAIDDIKEPEDEDSCSENNIGVLRFGLAGRIARVQSLASVVKMYQVKFDKELADRAADPCGNSLLAYCYTQAGDAAADLNFQVDQIRDEATSLIMTLALCPDVVTAAGDPVTFQSVIKDLAGAGSARAEAEAALATMQARLGDNGCDEEEFEDLADRYTEDGQDPDEMQDGGTMGEIGGDGVDNDQDGLQEEDWTEVAGKNVTIVVYDSGNFKDDVFNLSVSGVGSLGLTPAGGLRTYGLDLAPGTYTATVSVVVAPDNCGTVTAIAMENGVQIGALGTGESCPPVGAALTMVFTVSGE